MEIFYKPPFRKFVKKQTRSFQLVIEDEVEEITISPDMGNLKRVGRNILFDPDELKVSKKNKLTVKS